MKTILANLVFLAISAPILAQTATLQELGGQLVQEPATTKIYTAREIITMNPQQPRAEAVAVTDGKFVAVGTLDEVKSVVSQHARIDTALADKVVIAGFIEQHVHPVLAALTMATKVISIEDWDAIDGFSPAVRDPQGYQERLLAALQEHRQGPIQGKPFISWGYHHYLHGPLSRAVLNQLAPDFPVIIWRRSCHEFFFNDAALDPNLTVLEQSPYDVAPEKLREIGVWGTMLEGRVQPVAEAGQRAALRPTDAHEAEMAEIRRLNAAYWGKLQRREGTGAAGNPVLGADSSATCSPGCACGLTNALATELVTQLKAERQ